MPLPDAVQTYLSALRDCLALALDQNLEGIILFGSGGLTDFDPAVSDVDVLAAVRAPLRDADRDALTAAARHDALPCPAVGLDLAIYRTEVLAHSNPPIAYEYALETGAMWGTQAHPPGAESELVLDLAVAREGGRTLLGPAPGSLIGAIPDPWIRAALAETIRWHRDALFDPFHDPKGTQAALNAARAWYWHVHGAFVSKTIAGRWAAERGYPVASEALQARHDPDAPALDEGEVAAFLDGILKKL